MGDARVGGGAARGRRKTCEICQIRESANVAKVNEIDKISDSEKNKSKKPRTEPRLWTSGNERIFVPFVIFCKIA